MPMRKLIDSFFLLSFKANSKHEVYYGQTNNQGLLRKDRRVYRNRQTGEQDGARFLQPNFGLLQKIAKRDNRFLRTDHCARRLLRYAVKVGVDTMKRNKIPYKRFCRESCAIDGNYYKEIMKVTPDDIKALTRSELNRIPLSWLYDWVGAHNLFGNSLAIDWLEAIVVSRQYPDSMIIDEKNNKVTIRSSLDENVVITAQYIYRGGKYYFFNVHEHGGYKSFTAIPELMERMNKWLFTCFSAKSKIMHDWRGISHVWFDGHDVYFKRLRDYRYQFICEDKDGNIRQDACEIGEYLRRSEMFNKESRQAWGVNKEIMLRVKNGDFPFLDVSDEYFVREIKYVCECATTEEAAYLSDMDGKTRFVPTKEVYGVEDITLRSYELRKRCGRVMPTALQMQITVDEKTYPAWWSANKQELYIESHGFGREIKITDGLQKRFTELLNSIKTKSIKRGAI